MGLPLQPFVRLMKKFGAKRVSRSAAREVAETVEARLMEVCREAVGLAKHAGRKTVTGEDVKLARKRLGV